MRKRNAPYKIFVKPLYTKDNGMYVMDITGVPFKSEYTWIEKISMSLPPTVIAGNHAHKHVEAFLAMTDGMDLYWQDAKKKIHRMSLYNKNKPFFLILPPYIPHAVKNNAKQDGIMVKFANEPPGEMIRFTLVK